MAIQFDNTNTGVVTLRPGTAADAIILGGLNGTASGVRSSVVGGDTCTASGTNSAVFGGQTNSASQPNAAIVGGNNNAASGNNSAVIGAQSSNASSVYAFIGGGFSHNASLSYAAVLGGSNNTASGDSSIVLGGRQGTTRGIFGSVVTSASVYPITPAAGVQQLATLLLARQTTDATATVLTSTASSATTTNQVILPNNSAYFFRGEVVAGVTGAGDTKGWYVEGVIKRGANAASTVLVGTPTVTSSYADAGASAWTITATADTTNGGLAITVTGQAATTIRWVAQIRTTEMTY
jgi:hypothetical protein